MILLWFLAIYTMHVAERRSEELHSSIDEPGHYLRYCQHALQICYVCDNIFATSSSTRSAAVVVPLA
jgi:hypothetical protein